MTLNCYKHIAEPAQDRTRRRVKLVDKVRETLNRYGYMELALPLYEHYDLLKETAYDFSDDSIIRFLDRNTGKSLVLRPDFTPQVCRAVTGYMKDFPLPLRVYYRGEVFRTVGMDRGHKSEKYQVGWELFGGSEVCGDTEMLLSLARAMESVGLTGYTVVLGDSLFLGRLLSLAGDYAQGLKVAIAGKKRHDIEKISKEAKFSQPFTELLLSMPVSFGGIDVIKRLKELSSFDSVLSQRVFYIEELFERLYGLGINKGTLVFDVSETKGLGYYTGVNFEVVHTSAGFSLGGGGRYDNLMDKFGRSITACGMALYIEELMQFDVCGDEGQRFDWLVIGWDNLTKAEKLRDEGQSVFFIADEALVKEFKEVYIFDNILGA